MLTAVFLSTLTSSLAAPAAPADPKTLADFEAIYDAELEKIAKWNLADMVSVQQAYSDYLGAELKKAVNTGDLQTYEKLEQEQKRFEKDRTIPADSPFQKSVAQVETKRISILKDFSERYVSALKTHQISLVKAQNIDGARAVQLEVVRVQALIAEYASKLPAVNPNKDIAVGQSSSKLSLTKPAAITVSRNNMELLVGNPAYNNAPYLITEVPKELKGYFFTQQAKRKETAVEFEVTEGGIVYCFGHNAPDDDWKETAWTVGINYNGNVSKLKVYKKTMIKGIYTLRRVDWLIFPKK